jgi:photosystem II stability/assembly factor-like uncharacterized protein
MKRFFRTLCIIFLLIITQNFQGFTKEPTVYVVTLSTGHYHTGMSIPLSALFYQPVAVDSNWKYLGRPNNRIYSLDVHLASKGKIMAMATHTGVHQSFDFGKTWKVTTDWRMTEVNNLKFDQQNPEIIYASSPYGFYKTINGGKFWSKHNDGLESIDAQFVSSIVIDAANKNRLLISTEDGVYISDNVGLSWERSSLSIRNVRIIVQHPTNTNIFAVGSDNNGIYFSTDGGKVWAKRDTGIMHPAFYTICFDPNNPDIIYAGGFQAGIYKSTDGGKKWKHTFKGLDNLDIHAIAVTPGNSNLVYAGTMGNGVYVSEDAGKSWQYIGIKNGFINEIKILEL